MKKTVDEEIHVFFSKLSNNALSLLMEREGRPEEELGTFLEYVVENKGLLYVMTLVKTVAKKSMKLVDRIKDYSASKLSPDDLAQAENMALCKKKIHQCNK